MSEGVRVETVHNAPGDAKTLRIETSPEPARVRGAPSRPMVFGMQKSTTALLAIVMVGIFALQVLALSQAADGGGRLLTVAIAAGSGVLALLYFVISITNTRARNGR